MLKNLVASFFHELHKTILVITPSFTEEFGIRADGPQDLLFREVLQGVFERLGQPPPRSAPQTVMGVHALSIPMPNQDIDW
jgi:hypothetical protein